MREKGKKIPLGAAVPQPLRDDCTAFCCDWQQASNNISLTPHPWRTQRIGAFHVRGVDVAKFAQQISPHQPLSHEKRASCTYLFVGEPEEVAIHRTER